MTVRYEIDFDKDGFGAGDNVTEYVITSYSKAGFDPTLLIDNRVAGVGELEIIVNNEDKRFSPEYASGALYGKLLPGLPVRVSVISGVNTYVIFYGKTTGFFPTPGEYGGKTASIPCEDMMAQARDAKISLPLQENQTSDYLIKLITSAAWRSGQSAATLYLRTVQNNDTLTIGDRTYTFKTSLTPAANEIALGSRFTSGGVSDAAVNLAAAINAETRSGTDYAAATERNEDITATGALIIGMDETARDSQNNLLDNSGATNFEALATSFQFGPANNEPSSIYLQRVYLLLQKVGNPAGTLTLRLETGPTLYPSGTLEHADATATLAESVLTTGWAWYAFDFASEFEVFSKIPGDPYFSAQSLHWFVLSSDRAADSSNYVQWGGDFAGSASRFNITRKVAGSWGSVLPGLAFVFWHGGKLELDAVARGAWGNGITLAQTGDRIILPDDEALIGGTDGPVGMISYETGKSTIESAGAGWTPTDTRALDAIADVVTSEFGLFWAALDGTLTFKNRMFPFLQTTVASSATFNGSFSLFDGGLTVNDIINRVRVMFAPTNTLAAGVVARARSPIEVPGSWGQDYANPADDIPAGGTTIITLPFVDPTTGDMIGAKDLTLPLVATTDYTIFERSDGTGVEYTTTDYMVISVAVRASGVEISFRNTAGGRLYVRNLQVRGLGIVAYEPTEAVKDDPDSLDDYGVKPYALTLPLSSTSISNLAGSIAQYLINRFKDAVYRVKEIGFEELEIGGVNLASLKIGDVITVSEDQTGVSAQRFMILGVRYRIQAQAQAQVNFILYHLGPSTYWKLGDATYGKLGSTTRLAI